MKMTKVPQKIKAQDGETKDVSNNDDDEENDDKEEKKENEQENLNGLVSFTYWTRKSWGVWKYLWCSNNENGSVEEDDKDVNQEQSNEIKQVEEKANYSSNSRGIASAMASPFERSTPRDGEE